MWIIIAFTMNEYKSKISQAKNEKILGTELFAWDVWLKFLFYVSLISKITSN